MAQKENLTKAQQILINHVNAEAQRRDEPPMSDAEIKEQLSDAGALNIATDAMDEYARLAFEAGKSLGWCKIPLTFEQWKED